MGRRVDMGLERGFTLLEVLISITIVAIGLVAFAGMQSTAVTGNVAAMDMTIATQLAEEMAERIRINGGDTPEIYNGLNTSTCTGLSTLAANDCNQWKARLESGTTGLPSVVGSVTVTSDSPINNTATIAVTVRWGRVITRSVTFVTIMETWLS